MAFGTPSTPSWVRVRPQTEGERVLFMLNRKDPELSDAPTEPFGVASIVWCDGLLRRPLRKRERAEPLLLTVKHTVMPALGEPGLLPGTMARA